MHRTERNWILSIFTLQNRPTWQNWKICEIEKTSIVWFHSPDKWRKHLEKLLIRVPNNDEGNEYLQTFRLIRPNLWDEILMLWFPLWAPESNSEVLIFFFGSQNSNYFLLHPCDSSEIFNSCVLSNGDHRRRDCYPISKAQNACPIFKLV